VLNELLYVAQSLLLTLSTAKHLVCECSVCYNQCMMYVLYMYYTQQGPEVVALLKRFDTDGDGHVSLQVSIYYLNVNCNNNNNDCGILLLLATHCSSAVCIVDTSVIST
jgi:hypothetical protein